jgi:hypothetical protein
VIPRSLNAIPHVVVLNRAEIAGVPGFNLGCWWSACGRAEKLLLMSGAKSANVAIVEHGVGRATFDAVWLT